jgi:hypothetical protein
MTTLEPGGDEEKRLRAPHLLRVETAKITDYLLNLDHPIGAGKAKFFKGVGFSEEKVEEFAAALRTHAAQNNIADVVRNSYGVKTVIDCFMPTPSGTAYCIRSVWNDYLDGAPPKLITAHPLSL